MEKEYEWGNWVTQVHLEKWPLKQSGCDELMFLWIFIVSLSSVRLAAVNHGENCYHLCWFTSFVNFL